MQEMKQKMICHLRAYPTYTKKLALLRNELAHIAQITPEEMLESMLFAKGENCAPPSAGHTSDKTAYIAMSYRQKAAEANRAVVEEISAQIWELERKVDRMEYCLAQLSPEQVAAVRGLYFECRPSWEIAEKMHICERTVFRYRDQAISEMLEMYLTLQQAGVEIGW